jgi:hypothetical protein
MADGVEDGRSGVRLVPLNIWGAAETATASATIASPRAPKAPPPRRTGRQLGVSALVTEWVEHGHAVVACSHALGAGGASKTVGAQLAVVAVLGP